MNSKPKPSRENLEGIAKIEEASNWRGNKTKRNYEKKSPETLEQRKERRTFVHTEKQRSIKRAGGSKGEK